MHYDIDNAIQILGQLEYERRVLDGQNKLLLAALDEKDREIAGLTTQRYGNDPDEILGTVTDATQEGGATP